MVLPTNRGIGENVQSCAIDPGAVATSIYKDSVLFSRPPASWVLRTFYAPPRDGAKIVIDALRAPWPRPALPRPEASSVQTSASSASLKGRAEGPGSPDSNHHKDLLVRRCSSHPSHVEDFSPLSPALVACSPPSRMVLKARGLCICDAVCLWILIVSRALVLFAQIAVPNQTFSRMLWLPAGYPINCNACNDPDWCRSCLRLGTHPLLPCWYTQWFALASHKFSR